MVDYLRVFHHVGFFLVLSVGKRLKVLTMSAFLMKDRLPSEVLDSDTHNRLQMRRAIQTRGDPTRKRLSAPSKNCCAYWSWMTILLRQTPWPCW